MKNKTDNRTEARQLIDAIESIEPIDSDYDESIDYDAIALDCCESFNPYDD